MVALIRCHQVSGPGYESLTALRPYPKRGLPLWGESISFVIGPRWIGSGRSSDRLLGKELGNALPYGGYDVTHNESGGTDGICHDAADFAIAVIRRWWQCMGKNR
jgi:hypothetical protein